MQQHALQWCLQFLAPCSRPEHHDCERLTDSLVHVQMLFADAMPAHLAEAGEQGELQAAGPSLHLALDTETQSLLEPFPCDTAPPPEQPPAEVFPPPS